MKRTAPGPVPNWRTPSCSAAAISSRSESPRYPLEFMRRNGFSPSPSIRNRGPRVALCGSTRVTTVSLPLRRPSASSRFSSLWRIASIRSCGMGSPLCQGWFELGSELLQHVLGHRGDVIGWLPAPFGSRRAIVDRARPRIRDRLPDRIDLVFDDELGDMLADLRRE